MEVRVCTKWRRLIIGSCLSVEGRMSRSYHWEPGNEIGHATHLAAVLLAGRAVSEHNAFQAFPLFRTLGGSSKSSCGISA